MKLQSKEKGERRTCNREVNQRYGWALYIQMIPLCQPSLEEVEIHHSLFHLMTNKQADKKHQKNQTTLPGQVFGFARTGACGPELFLQRRKSECLQSLRKFLQPPA